MGSGSWTTKAFTSYATTAYNVTLDSFASDGTITTNLCNQDIFKSYQLNEKLNPHNVIRECLDSEEHPNTIPVILALDVTGSMGDAATEVAKKLSGIMTKLYDKLSDVEFMIMGIGDLAYDHAPIQASQFESDIRIAEQLDKVYFEFGGGGNHYESYTAAWYFGAYQTKLDCWNRGRRGIIITMGDEELNPYLPGRELREAVGNGPQGDIETKDLYEAVTEKYDVYHIQVNHGSWHTFTDEIKRSWSLLGQNVREATLDNISDVICDIIESAVDTTCVGSTKTQLNENNEIVW